MPIFVSCKWINFYLWKMTCKICLLDELLHKLSLDSNQEYKFPLLGINFPYFSPKSIKLWRFPIFLVRWPPWINKKNSYGFISLVTVQPYLGIYNSNWNPCHMLYLTLLLLTKTMNIRLWKNSNKPYIRIGNIHTWNEKLPPGTGLPPNFMLIL